MCGCDRECEREGVGVCVRACARACERACVSACARACVGTGAHPCVRACVLCVRARARARTCLHACVRACMRTRALCALCVRARMRACVCTVRSRRPAALAVMATSSAGESKVGGASQNETSPASALGTPGWKRANRRSGGDLGLAWWRRARLLTCQGCAPGGAGARHASQ